MGGLKGLGGAGAMQGEPEVRNQVRAIGRYRRREYDARVVLHEEAQAGVGDLALEPEDFDPEEILQAREVKRVQVVPAFGIRE